MPSFPSRWRRRLRSWVRRSAVAWWTGVVVLALLTGGVVRSTLARSSAVLDELGPMQAVVVAARDVPIGAVISPGDVVEARRPVSTLPDGAGVDDLVGRVAVVPLLANEVVVGAKVAPDGLQGAAALLPAGQRALSIPGGPAGRPPASVGDRVDLLATDETGTFVVVAGALVLALDDESDAVTIAVPAGDAPDVAAAISTATVTLALTAPTR